MRGNVLTAAMMCKRSEIYIQVKYITACYNSVEACTPNPPQKRSNQDSFNSIAANNTLHMSCSPGLPATTPLS